MNYWQVAAGDGQRDFSEVFLNRGCMLIGPGQYGDYTNNYHKYKDRTLVTKNDDNQINAFVWKVKAGDIVVLKKPSGKKWEVIAIGKILFGYSYQDRFDDIEGWDLSHHTQMKWAIPNKKTIISGLTRGTFKRINKKSTIEKIDDVYKTSKPFTSKAMPKPQEILSDDDLIELLIDYGLRPKDAEDFTHTINRIRRLVRWYQKKGKNVKEHETRTFLIVPLLLALGWPEQKLKIEWNHIDIAFFEKPYTDENNESNDCVVILESKKLWDGLSPAASQVEQYANQFPKCKKVIVSDGCCYKLFERKGKSWEYTAYLNILKPRRKHPYNPKVGGAPDVFLSLMGR